MAQAKRGDINALMALCKAIVEDIFFKANCILDNQMDADDVVQEVLIRVCAKIKDLKDPKAFNAWLGTIIVNESRRQLSKNSKNIVFDIDDFTETELEENEECLPQEYIENEEARDSVMGAVRMLPERQREAVVLHYYDEMSITETAKTMGVTQQAASLYLKLARERIKGSISERAGLGEPGFLQSIAAAPLGPMITKALQNESGLFAQANKGLTQHAMDGCTAYIKKMAVRTAVRTGAVPVGLKLGIAAAVFVAAFGLWASIVPGQAAAQDLPGPGAGPAVNADGSLVFSGGDANYVYLNPKHAVPVTNSDSGDLTVQSWKITTLDGKAVLFSGAGGDADEALASMRDSAEDGEYVLYFSMKDTLGNDYVLDSNFLILKK